MSERGASTVATGEGLTIPGDAGFKPGVPANLLPVPFQNFMGGVNTLVSRAAINNAQGSWVDGWMTLGPDSIRIIPDADPDPIYTTEGPTIVWYGFVNLSNVFYAIVLRVDGSVVAVNIDNQIVTTLLAAGTITTAGPLTAAFRISQFSSQYVLMVAPQPNGYWIWDGTNIYTAGTVGPIVSITDPGMDYVTPPNVTIGVPQSNGTVSPVCTAEAFIENGMVTKIVITGILVTDLAIDAQIIVAFSGGGNGTSSAFGEAVVNNGVIVSAVITNGGSGYGLSSSPSLPTATVTDPTGTGAILYLPQGIGGGIVPSLGVQTGGVNYTDPVVDISGGDGSGATGEVTTQNGVITSYDSWNNGSGYGGTPGVNFLSSTGVGASATPQVANGSIVGLNLPGETSPGGGTGSNYSNPTYVTFTNGNGPASATIALMPYGVSGTAIEVYKDRVWIPNGRAFLSEPVTTLPPARTLFSAAESPVNFGGDGGAFPATDYFTRIGYMQVVQTNGFLYLVGDNCLNYISNVNVSSTPATTTQPAGPAVTTFSNVNADPQIGSLWPSSVQVFSRNIIFANPLGIYISIGGAVTKISEPFDGIYFTQSGTTNNTEFDFPSAVATIFGRPVYLLQFPIINPLTNGAETILLMFDGQRCFTTHQGFVPTFIATLSRFSNLFAYGTNGTSIHRMFAQGSMNFYKILQSKLYANPTYWSTKVANELHLLLKPYKADSYLWVTVDNENGLGTGNAAVIINPGGLVIWQNNAGGVVTFENNALAIVSFGGVGYSVIGPTPVANVGRLLGVTICTIASDIELNSLTIQERTETLNI
ncbi:MAG TPA: hypothetical protein VGR84_18955 [Candidatus Acidoferrales bacterium]|nr:hypothetical protein [Candidatus Acidoferrales bacterium]